MNWPGLFRPSGYFAVVAALLFAAGVIPRVRESIGASLNVYLHAYYVVVSPTVLLLLLGGLFLAFAGVYGVWEKDHMRPSNLILGHIHFWLTLLPVAALLQILHRNSVAAVPSAGSVDFRGVVLAELKTLITSLVIFLTGQFAFLTNLALKLFQRGAQAG